MYSLCLRLCQLLSLTCLTHRLNSETSYFWSAPFLLLLLFHLYIVQQHATGILQLCFAWQLFATFGITHHLSFEAYYFRSTPFLVLLLFPYILSHLSHSPSEFESILLKICSFLAPPPLPPTYYLLACYRSIVALFYLTIVCNWY
jgi:hypothetical protein